jgi:hypothetical protein
MSARLALPPTSDRESVWTFLLATKHGETARSVQTASSKCFIEKLTSLFAVQKNRFNMVFWKSLTLLLLVLGSAHGTLRGQSFDEGEQDLDRVSRLLGKDKEVKDGGGGAVGGGAVGGGAVGGGAVGGGGGAAGGGGTTTEVVTTTIDTTCSGTDTVVSTNAVTGRVTTLSKCGVKEQMPCLNPVKVVANAKNNPQTQLACLSGTCQGCCRYFNYLVCDTLNLYSHLPCLCNAYTYGGNPFA